jgi:hypothetical protein
MTRALHHNKRRQEIVFSNEILYKSSYAKNSNYRIALQLYYINKQENKKVARLPKNDFRRPIEKPQKEISPFRKFISQLNFDFANVFVHKIIYR